MTTTGSWPRSQTCQACHDALGRVLASIYLFLYHGGQHSTVKGIVARASDGTPRTCSGWHLRGLGLWRPVKRARRRGQTRAWLGLSFPFAANVCNVWYLWNVGLYVVWWAAFMEHRVLSVSVLTSLAFAKTAIHRMGVWGSTCSFLSVVPHGPHGTQDEGQDVRPPEGFRRGRLLTK